MSSALNGFGEAASASYLNALRLHPRDFEALYLRGVVQQEAGNLGEADGAADLYLDLDLRGTPLLDFSEAEPTIDRGFESAIPRIEEWLADVEMFGRLPETEA